MTKKKRPRMSFDMDQDLIDDVRDYAKFNNLRLKDVATEAFEDLLKNGKSRELMKQFRRKNV